MEAEKNSEISFAEFTLDPRKRRLLRGQKTVSLNARAFDLLYFLTQHAGRIVSKEEILDSVWKDQFVEESNLAVQISAIRRALGDKAGEPRFLVTVPGKGYQFVAPVSWANESVEADRYAAATVRDGLDAKPGNAKHPADSNRWFAVFASVVVLIAVSWFAYKYFVGSTAHVVRSIAVVPFVEQTSDPPTAFLGEGMAESVIFSLSRVPGIRVMSRESAFRYRDQIDPKQIGRELNVDGVLTGRITQSGDTISIRSALASSEDNSVIWSEQFTRKMSDMQRLQVDIAESIARELKIKLSGGEQAHLERNQTANSEAYQLYLFGRFHLNRLTDDGFLKGRDAFRKAIDTDPNYALAHAGLADAYNMLCGWGAMAPNEGYPLAKASATRALELDDTLAEAHTALGVAKLFYDVDWVGAEKELTRAIELNPNYSDARMMYGHELMLLGRFDEARPYMSRAADLDPLSIIKIVSVGNVSYFERDFPKALDIYRRALEMDSNSGLAHWSLGNTLMALHRNDEAIAEFQKAIALSGDSPDEPTSLALAFAAIGSQDGARKIIDELSARSSQAYVPPSLIASIYGALGENDKAFGLLDRAFRERDSLLVYLKVDPMLDPLRKDARYAELLRRLELP
jgi:DNA-binding winged helix-turn-helix (wHTH) protein/TolB-like protein/Tfp pilus assembly protein PilF